jgi:hypothetical protein
MEELIEKAVKDHPIIKEKYYELQIQERARRLNRFITEYKDIIDYIHTKIMYVLEDLNRASYHEKDETYNCDFNLPENFRKQLLAIYEKRGDFEIYDICKFASITKKNIDINASIDNFHGLGKYHSLHIAIKIKN